MEDYTFEDIQKEEFGHSIQSRYLGPLYMPAIGIGSAAANIRARILELTDTGLKGQLFKFPDYYEEFPTERWATDLGSNKY